MFNTNTNTLNVIDLLLVNRDRLNGSIETANEILNVANAKSADVLAGRIVSDLHLSPNEDTMKELANEPSQTNILTFVANNPGDAIRVLNGDKFTNPATILFNEKGMDAIVTDPKLKRMVDSNYLKRQFITDALLDMVNPNYTVSESEVLIKYGLLPVLSNELVKTNILDMVDPAKEKARSKVAADMHKDFNTDDIYYKLDGYCDTLRSLIMFIDNTKSFIKQNVDTCVLATHIEHPNAAGLVTKNKEIIKDRCDYVDKAMGDTITTWLSDVDKAVVIDLHKKITSQMKEDVTSHKTSTYISSLVNGHA